jgi:hypothetical protein
MPRTFPMHFFLHPLLILLLLLRPPPVPRTFLSWRLYFFGLLIEIGKEISFWVGPESLFELGDGVDGHLKLLLLENKALFFFVDDFDGLFDLMVEVESESFKGKLDICDFLETKIYKIFIISPFDLLVVGVDLGVEEGGEVALKVIAFGCAHAYLHVRQDHEVVDAGVLVGLKLPLEQLSLAVGAELVEELPRHAYKLLVGVVSGPLVLLLPLVDAPHLLLQAGAQLHAAHRTINFLYIHCHRGLFELSTFIYPLLNRDTAPPCSRQRKRSKTCPGSCLSGWEREKNNYC